MAGLVARFLPFLRPRIHAGGFPSAPISGLKWLEIRVLHLNLDLASSRLRASWPIMGLHFSDVPPAPKSEGYGRTQGCRKGHRGKRRRFVRYLRYFLPLAVCGCAICSISAFTLSAAAYPCGSAARVMSLMGPRRSRQSLLRPCIHAALYLIRTCIWTFVQKSMGESDRHGQPSGWVLNMCNNI